MRTGLVWDERYMWHDPGPGAAVERAGGWIEPGDLMAETPATKRRMRNLVEVAGLLEHLVPVAPRFATEEELLRFHTREHLERVRTLSEGVGGSVGFDAWAGTGTYDIARLAAGGTMAAVDAVLDGTVEACYALVRPPGHHAMAEAGAGFCVFGNVALAVMHARAVRGVGRVAVVDWDVHHGNGTQDAFWTEPDVLAVSLHQDRCLLPSGGLEETGEGDGAARRSTSRCRRGQARAPTSTRWRASSSPRCAPSGRSSSSSPAASTPTASTRSRGCCCTRTRSGA